MSTAMDNERVCGTCGKRFYIGIAINSYIFKIVQSKGTPPKYYCKYSCYKPAVEVKPDGRGKLTKKKRRDP